MTDPRTRVEGAGRLAALWAGLLVAPAAFLVNLELSYLAVPAGCARGTALSLHLIHAASLLVALAGGLVAWRSWRRAGIGWPGETGGPDARSRFLAGLGLAASGLFALAIVAQWVPTFALHPCQ